MKLDSSQDSGRPLKWGILGAARIADRKFVRAIREAGGEVVAVGASTRARAEDFARRHEIARASDYQGALEDEEVEAVYLPLCNALHVEWAVKTARAGKPCLCEKPLALTTRDAREIQALFRQSGLRLVEGFMWRHHPQMDFIREQLTAGRIGELRRINAAFSYALDRAEDYRWRAELGGGVMWDVGSYCVNAARYFFGREPLCGSVRAHYTEPLGGVDETAAGWLDFGHDRLATFSCSLKSAFAQGLELVGTAGRIWCGKPWNHLDMPTRVMIECDGRRSIQEFEPVNAYELMARHFTRAVRDSSYSLRPAEDGVAQAAAMEGLQKSARERGAVWMAGGDCD